MKKIALLFTAAVLVLTSCTKDKTDAAPTAAPGMLKAFTTDGQTTTLSYDGSKILKEEFPTFSENYTYTGDLITFTTYADGAHLGNTTYTYANGKLTKELTQDNGGSGSTLSDSSSRTYTYNSDGTITVQEYDHSNGQVLLAGTSKYTFENGNLVRYEDFNAQGNSDDVITYEYDTQKNPFKKIVGFDQFLDAEATSVNNVVKSTETYPSGSSSTTTVYTNVYTYNPDGYPVTKTSSGVHTVGTGTPQTKTSSTQYTY